MTLKSGKTRKASAQCHLPRSEWDFRKVPPKELFACMDYELLRESLSMRERAASALETYKELSVARGHDPAVVALPTFEEFRDRQKGASLLTLIALATNGFPEKPWQELGDARFRRSVGKCLDWWRTLPKAIASAAPVIAAVEPIGIKPHHDAMQALESAGYSVETILYLTSRDIPETHDVLLIDPNAKDEDIIDGVRSYLALPHRAKNVSGEPKKTAQGGRPPNFNRPRDVLDALGMMRLVHDLTVEEAWTLVHPNKKSSNKNVEVGRARELCWPPCTHRSGPMLIVRCLLCVPRGKPRLLAASVFLV